MQFIEPCISHKIQKLIKKTSKIQIREIINLLTDVLLLEITKKKKKCVMRPCMFLLSKTNWHSFPPPLLLSFLNEASYLWKCSGWWNSASLFYYNTFLFAKKEKVTSHVISLLYLTSCKACILKGNRTWYIRLSFRYPQEPRCCMAKEPCVDADIPWWLVLFCIYFPG